jgi:hypothetical protein
MALVFTTLPGANERALVNVVPGLQTRGSRGIRGPETGAALKLTQRREKNGKLLGRVCFLLSVLYVGAVLVRLFCQESWTGMDALIFDWIWFVTCTVVHVGVFVAEGLRGRDAPWAVWSVVLFWIGQLVMWML